MLRRLAQVNLYPFEPLFLRKYGQDGFILTKSPHYLLTGLKFSFVNLINHTFIATGFLLPKQRMDHSCPTESLHGRERIGRVLFAGKHHSYSVNTSSLLHC